MIMARTNICMTTLKVGLTSVTRLRGRSVACLGSSLGVVGKSGVQSKVSVIVVGTY